MTIKSLFVVPLLLASGALAQQNPAPRGGGGGGEGFDNPPPFNRGNVGPGGAGNMGGGGNMLPPGMFQVDMMRNWLDLIDRYARMSRDPVSSGIAAVVGANDILRSKPPEQAIEFFSKMLTQVKNEAVQRCIRIQLVELYSKTNQQELALEQLRLLMTSVPEGPNVQPPPPPDRGPAKP